MASTTRKASAEVYFDSCDQYDGEPGWMFRFPNGETINLATTDAENDAAAIAEARKFFTGQIEIGESV